MEKAPLPQRFRVASKSATILVEEPVKAMVCYYKPRATRRRFYRVGFGPELYLYFSATIFPAGAPCRMRPWSSFGRILSK